MLSGTSRSLTYLNAVLYAVLGFCLFVFPATLAPAFAWKVTAFMTMTIGGWCLGNAWLAWCTARRWEWNRVFSSLYYLWLFGIGELLVLIFFRDKLILKHPIAWFYLVTLIVNVLTALLGGMEFLRAPIAPSSAGPTLSRGQIVAVLAFVLFAGFLGIYGCTAPLGAVGTNGGIFPEVMSQFTLRSFGVFYLCLALAVAPHLWNRNVRALLHHSFAAFGFIVFITLAAFVYLGLFDFKSHPGGLLYFGAYFGVGIPLLFVFRKNGTGN